MRRFLLSTAFILVSFGSMASGRSSDVDTDLFVVSRKQLISVGELIKNEHDVQSIYGFEKFCYKGSPDKVLKLMEKYKATDLFFSGGGGGFEYLGGKVIHGVASYDLHLVFKDEVVEGELKRTIVKPCPVLQK